MNLVRCFAFLLGCACCASTVADTGPEHRAPQPEPIQLGSSGANIHDSSGSYCCVGTLGAVVRDTSGTLHVLSNNHVLARVNQASVGDTIIHPGLVDQSPVCAADTTDIVGSLVNFVPIKFPADGHTPSNEVDAAIAQAVPGTVRDDGAILDVGTISPNTLSPLIGMPVQKSGRTTGHTLGSIAAVGVTVDVSFSEVCGGPVTHVGRFVNQIRVTPGTFSAGGDSGSLVVEHGSVDLVNGRPRAVGLLFAGNSDSTLVNPINKVLNALGVTLVGAPPPEPPAGQISGSVFRSSDGAAIAGATVTTGSGASALTGIDGSYLLTSVPEGAHTLTAAAAGYQSQTVSVVVANGAMTTQNFRLAPVAAEVSASKLTVPCITWNTTAGPTSTRDLLMTFLVTDDLGHPVPGVEVRFDLLRDGKVLVRKKGRKTDSSGQVTYGKKRAGDGEYQVRLVKVLGPLPFDGSTPENLFRKGTDPVPEVDCAGDPVQPSGTAITAGATSGSANMKTNSADANSTGGTSLQPAGRPGIGNAGAGTTPSGRVPPGLVRALEVKQRNDARLFAHKGVVGTGVAAHGTGSPVIEVYLSEDEAETRAKLPRDLEGVPVEVKVTGPFRALCASTGSGD